MINVVIDQVFLNVFSVIMYLNLYLSISSKLILKNAILLYLIMNNSTINSIYTHELQYVFIKSHVFIQQKKTTIMTNMWHINLFKCLIYLQNIYEQRIVYCVLLFTNNI